MEPDLIAQYPDLAAWVIGILSVFGGYFFMRTQRLITKTLQVIHEGQVELFKRVGTLEKDFYVMQGEHRVNHIKGKTYVEVSSPRIEEVKEVINGES